MASSAPAKNANVLAPFRDDHDARILSALVPGDTVAFLDEEARELGSMSDALRRALREWCAWQKVVRGQ
jgi:hypothetical protein